MLRPRWHDALLVCAVAGLLVVGIWALWWEDVRALWNDAPPGGSAVDKPGSVAPQT
jgi:hypothetical protein